jgi:hypothetical protein
MTATANLAKRVQALRLAGEMMSSVGTGQRLTDESDVIVPVPRAAWNGDETLALLRDGAAASAAAIVVADQLAAWLLVRRRLGSSAAPGLSTAF